MFVAWIRVETEMNESGYLNILLSRYVAGGLKGIDTKGDRSRSLVFHLQISAQEEMVVNKIQGTRKMGRS